MLSGERMDSITRVFGNSVEVPATCVENWDMLAVIHLLQSNVFPEKVHHAVNIMNEYTRRDIAHERFDADWKRDCGCMRELLDALGCPAEAAKLRAFCQSKRYDTSTGVPRL